MYVPECKLSSAPVLIQFLVKAECKLVISTSVVAACIIRSSGAYTHECQIMNCRIIAIKWGKAGFRKCRVTRDQIANIHWIMEKAREFQKNIYFCFIDYAKAFDYFDCVGHINCGKFFKRWEYQTT